MINKKLTWTRSEDNDYYLKYNIVYYNEILHSTDEVYYTYCAPRLNLNIRVGFVI